MRELTRSVDKRGGTLIRILTDYPQACFSFSGVDRRDDLFDFLVRENLYQSFRLSWNHEIREWVVGSFLTEPGAKTFQYPDFFVDGER